MSSEDSEFVGGFRSISDSVWSKQQRKHLYDLAEGAPWSDDRYRDALRSAARWLVRELELDRFPVVAAPAPALSIAAARTLALSLPEKLRPRDSAAAREVCSLAPLVDANPRTLSNQLTRRSTVRRLSRSLRWVRWLGRLADESLPLDAWLYHRRTPASVAAQVRGWATRSSFDVGDELLALSLLALWQRRRPTDEVRANRAKRKTRSKTPKPVVALIDELIASEQRTALLSFADTLDEQRRRALVLFVIEAVLTAAHARSQLRKAKASALAVDGALAWAQETIDSWSESLGDDADTLRFRVATQRAYAKRVVVEWSDVSDEYVRASLCAARHKAGVDGECEESFEVDAPGVCMLLPQLREKGRIVR